MNITSQAGPDYVQTSLFTSTIHPNDTFSDPHFESKTPRSGEVTCSEEERTVATEGWPGPGKAGAEAGRSACSIAEHCNAWPCGHVGWSLRWEKQDIGNNSSTCERSMVLLLC